MTDVHPCGPVRFEEGVGVGPEVLRAQPAPGSGSKVTRG
jgi:hypothetical protein